MAAINRLQCAMAILLLACASCGSSTSEPTEASDPAEARMVVDPNSFPAVLEGADGWHGVKIARTRSSRAWICRVEFPENFGANDVEWRFLAHLATRIREFQGDSDCAVDPYGMYAALDHLVVMATQRSDLRAATAIVRHEIEGAPFPLDGESAEIYPERYLIPVLESFAGIESVVRPQDNAKAALSICSLANMYKSVGQQEFAVRARALADSLQKRGAGVLAQAILDCDALR